MRGRGRSDHRRRRDNLVGGGRKVEPLVLAALPGRLRWQNEPKSFSSVGSDGLRIEAGAKTDLFFDPARGADQASGIDNAPAALFGTSDDQFILSAYVEVEFSSTFDAAVLVVRAARDQWAKLCFEYSPANRPMVVSVVTRGASDDCNSAYIERSGIHLRIARLNKAFAFHYSQDGRNWNLVRHFTLGEIDRLEAGFLSQSPTGGGCRSSFSEIRYLSSPLNDIRSGE